MHLVSIILTVNYIGKLIIVFSICRKYWINKRTFFFFVIRELDLDPKSKSLSHAKHVPCYPRHSSIKWLRRMLKTASCMWTYSSMPYSSVTRCRNAWIRFHCSMIFYIPLWCWCYLWSVVPGSRTLCAIKGARGNTFQAVKQTKTPKWGELCVWVFHW